MPASRRLKSDLAWERFERDRKSFVEEIRDLRPEVLHETLQGMAQQRPEDFLAKAEAAAAVLPAEMTIEEKLRRGSDMNTFDRTVAIYRELLRRSPQAA